MATNMIGIIMGSDKMIKRVNSTIIQMGENLFSPVSIITGVDEHCLSCGSLKQDTLSLTDIDHIHTKPVSVIAGPHRY